MQYEKSKTMGTAYKIRCRYCGTQFDHYNGNDYGTTIMCIGCGHVETEAPIRCPACMGRINTSQEEFDKQIETVMMWD